jgi:HEPN domain-containing protein
MNPNNPHDWLIKADRDLRLAKIAHVHSPDAPDLICYHCQQAAEKSLKALVVHYKLPLRKTHDLEDLLDTLSTVDPTIDIVCYSEALKIKNYAVGIRYPDTSGDPTESDVLEAIASAEFFRALAETTLGQ